MFTTNVYEKEETMRERYQLFTTIIANINRSIKRIKTEEMAEFDLKSVHLSCLYYLHKQSMTAKELCRVCEEDKANVSRCVEYLEENGYINPRPTGSKRYKAPLELTEQGHKAAEIINVRVGMILDAASVGISNADREILYRSLGIISENLQKICDNYDAEE